MFPNRGLCERFLPIFKILVSHNLFSVTNNIQSYLLEELNMIDWNLYKADGIQVRSTAVSFSSDACKKHLSRKF